MVSRKSSKATQRLAQQRLAIAWARGEIERIPLDVPVSTAMQRNWCPMQIHFTSAAQKTLQLAYQEAQRQNCHFLGVEHVILGAIKLNGPAAAAITENGLTLSSLRELTKRQTPSLPDFAPIDLPNTPGVDRAIRYAVELMELRRAESLRVSDLILGVLREAESYGATFLALFDVQAVKQSLTDLGDLTGACVAERQPPALDHTPSAPEFTNHTAVLRILDASANRAAEGLRVVEDYVRFVLDDRQLTAEVKRLRHMLAAAVALLGRPALLASRDTAGDVGVDAKESAELHRTDAQSVATASLQRAEQALRSLGEFGKLVSGQAAAQFEAIRYATYQLESRLAARNDRHARLAAAQLYVLVDGCNSIEAFSKLVGQLIGSCNPPASGVDVIQLRDKQLPDRELVERGRLLRRLLTAVASKTLFIINDRPDLAVLCDADGVHVGQDELGAADARRIIGHQRLVGVSTHDIAQAEQAARDGADYIGVGPTFPSTTKQFTEFPGLELAHYVAANVAVPAFAIGGITLANVAQVLATGIRGIAIGAAVSQAANPGDELAKFRVAFRSAKAAVATSSRAK